LFPDDKEYIYEEVNGKAPTKKIMMQRVSEVMQNRFSKTQPSFDLTLVI
jgi:hypothetical protein